jgi:hypothetical protein
MPHFTHKLDVQEMLDGVQHRLLVPFGFDDGHECVVAPQGFVTDYASIPPLGRIAAIAGAIGMVAGLAWLVWTALAVAFLSSSLLHSGIYQRAAVIHDYLYRTRSHTRGKSDWILYEAMTCCRTPVWQRVVIYLNVRFFGWMVWNDPRRKFKIIGINCHDGDAT